LRQTTATEPIAVAESPPSFSRRSGVGRLNIKGIEANIPGALASQHRLLMERGRLSVRHLHKIYSINDKDGKPVSIDRQIRILW